MTSENSRKNPENHWLYKGLKKVLSSPEKLIERVEKHSIVRDEDLELCADVLINKKLTVNTAYGVASGAASIIPVFGSIGALAASATVEFAAVTYLEMELCMELAYLYGHDITDEKRIFEMLAIIGRKRKISDASSAESSTASKAVNTTMKKFMKLGLMRAIGKAATNLETRLGAKALSRAVPVVGLFFGGAFNYITTRNTATIARGFYSELPIEARLRCAVTEDGKSKIIAASINTEDNSV